VARTVAHIAEHIVVLPHLAAVEVHIAAADWCIQVVVAAYIAAAD
jgi:hypothetical protein